jgi:hypothetical protein
MPLGGRRQCQRDAHLLFDGVEPWLEVLLKKQGQALGRKRGLRHDGAGKVAVCDKRPHWKCTFRRPTLLLTLRYEIK